MTDYVVSTEATFNSTAASLVAGDTLTITPGNYSDWGLSCPAGGASGNVVTIIGDGVTFGGNSQINVTADYVTITGLQFTDVTFDGDPGSCIKLNGASFCVVDNCGFLRAKRDLYVASHLVGIQFNGTAANDNTVSNCVFDDTGSIPVGIHLNAGDAVCERLHIHHNIFQNTPSGNVLSAIQLGQGLDTETEITDALIESNTFLNWKGDTELISLKSSGNTVRYNYVNDCTAFRCRSGNDNELYNNNFVGGTRALSISGMRHIIRDNWIRPAGTDAIVFDYGDGYTGGNDLTAAEDCVVTGNIVECINNSQRGIRMFVNGQTVTPRGNTFSSNVIYGGQIGTMIDVETQESLDENTFTNNVESVASYSSLSNVATLTVQTTGADLYNGVVTPGTDTATATVDSFVDTGTLYMAIRTSGPYGEGDKDDIKNAVGAIDNGSKTPVIGTNTFNVTGLSSDTDYHCGFTIETADPATGYELDVTTEGAGVFTVSRVGNAVGVADDDDLHIVGQDKPVLVGGTHDGTDFAAPCAGLLTHSPSTNTLQWSGATANNYRDVWNNGDGSIDAGTETLLGDFYLSTPYYTSNSPSQLYLARGQDGTSYPGPWTWTIYVVKGTAPGFSVEFNNSRGTANYAWNGTVPELQSVEDGAVSWAYHVNGNIWAVVLVVPGTSNQWKNVHFYPDMKGNTVVSGQYTSFMGGQLVDKGIADSIIHPMSNEDSITVNANQPQATMANMGVPDISGDFTVEYKFKIYVDNLNQSQSRNLFALHGDDDNRLYVYFSGGSRQLKVAFFFAGVTYYRTMSDILPDQEYHLIIRGDTATGTIARWFNGVKANWAGIMGTFAVPVTLMKLGSSTGSNSGDAVMPHIMTGMKLYDGALDDTIIEGWL